jgi:Mn2+/Fe2+ NRAMP family transporter
LCPKSDVPTRAANGALADVMLLIIAIVGTTVAPWQLFFQQSYVVDKRITPRFIRYERFDLWLGIGLVMIGAVAMMAFSTTAFEGTADFGQFKDTGAVAVGLAQHAGRLVGVLFALALIDACIIGASAVSLSTAYAIGDVLSLRHSLHRKPTDAKGFYAVYFGLITISAALVLTPGTPLGLLTNAVQTLAGVLLPGATVFLLLLCNDKAVLGPWVNSLKVNVFTGSVIAVLVMLSVILTASVMFPNITGTQIVAVLVGGSTLALVATVVILVWQRRRGAAPRTEQAVPLSERATWRMPPLAELPAPELTVLNLVFLTVLRGYLLIAGGLVLVKIAQLISSGR